MRAAVERDAEAARAASAGTTLGSTALFGSTALVAAAAAFFSGGSSNTRLFWIGGAALLVVAVFASAALAGHAPWPRVGTAGLVFLAALAGFVLWNGLSVVWSIAPDRSWDYFNRGVVYLAFAALGLLIAAQLRGAPRLAAAGFAVVLAAVVAWSLAGKVVPALAPDNARIARLHEPVEYWNALALLAAMALPLALWIAARREHADALRAGGCVFAYATVVALMLTYSRGGIAVGAVAALVWLALGSPRVESAAALAIAAPPALGVAAWAFTRPGIAENAQPYSTRVRDGALFGVVLCLAGAAVFVGSHFASSAERRRPVTLERRRLLGRIAAGALLAGLVIALGAALAAGVEPRRFYREFTQPANPELTQGPQRITLLSSSSRWEWWKEAWFAFEDDPLLGTGAGSFELTHRMRRTNGLYVTEPHSLVLQFLSETGIVGFALALAAAVAGVAAAAGALRRLGDARERAAAVALLVGVIAYLLHALVDFHWDFVAVTGLLFLVLGVLVAAGRPAGRAAPRPLWALGLAALALAGVASVGAPWLAAREVDDAYAALDRDSPRDAAASAELANSLNPLSIEPLHAWAAAETARGRAREAERLYARAVELQPENSETWYELANFELDLGRREQGMRYLERAAQLDPQGPPAKKLAALRQGG